MEVRMMISCRCLGSFIWPLLVGRMTRRSGSFLHTKGDILSSSNYMSSSSKVTVAGTFIKQMCILAGFFCLFGLVFLEIMYFSSSAVS